MANYNLQSTTYTSSVGTDVQRQVMTDNQNLHRQHITELSRQINVAFGYRLRPAEIRFIMALPSERREFIIDNAPEIYSYLKTFNKSVSILQTHSIAQLVYLPTATQLHIASKGMFNEDEINQILDNDQYYKFYAQHLPKIMQLPKDVKSFILNHIDLFLHMSVEEVVETLKYHNIENILGNILYYNKKTHPEITVKLLCLPEARELTSAFDRAQWIKKPVAELLYQRGTDFLSTLSGPELSAVVDRFIEHDINIAFNILQTPALRQILLKDGIKSLLRKNIKLALAIYDDNPENLNQLKSEDFAELLRVTAKDFPEISIKYFNTKGIFKHYNWTDKLIPTLYKINPEIRTQVEKPSEPIRELYHEFRTLDDNNLLKVIAGNPERWMFITDYAIDFPFYMRLLAPSNPNYYYYHDYHLPLILPHYDDLCLDTLTQFVERALKLLLQVKPLLSIDFYERGSEFLAKLSKNMFLEVIKTLAKVKPEIAVKILTTKELEEKLQNLMQLPGMSDLSDLGDMLQANPQVVRILIEQHPDYFLKFQEKSLDRLCLDLGKENSDLAHEILSLPKVQQQYPKLQERFKNYVFNAPKNTSIYTASSAVLFAASSAPTNQNNTVAKDTVGISIRKQKENKKKHRKK